MNNHLAVSLGCLLGLAAALPAAPAPLPGEDPVLEELCKVRWLSIDGKKLQATFKRDGTFEVRGVKESGWWEGKGFVGTYRRVPCESEYWTKYRLQRRMFYPNWPGHMAEDVMFLRLERWEIRGVGFQNATLILGR